MKKTPVSLFLRSWLLILIFVCASPLSAQDSRFERRFSASKAEVDSALAKLQTSLKGRLPILEGFVEQNNEPLDRFQRGFYECVAQVSADADGRTLVRLGAKITAWYADPTAAQSGYRELPSSGRIETDLLDQLADLLGNKSTGNASADLAVAPRPTSISLNAPAGAALAEPPRAAAIALTNEDIDTLRKQREDAEKKAKALDGHVRDLEEILRNQAHPDNLAVVRKAGTAVLAKPGGATLLSADAEDEFEIIGVEGNWVHVQISGASRGWIQRALLDLPKGFAKAGSEAVSPAFRATREETHPFTGTWPALQGKSVRIFWVEPASSDSTETSSTEAKRKFTLSLFARAYKEQSGAGAPPEGVVIVFDSADGGQIAATMSNLAQWTAGKLSEDSFWKQCSIDPPDLFEAERHPEPVLGARPLPSRGQK